MARSRLALLSWMQALLPVGRAPRMRTYVRFPCASRLAPHRPAAPTAPAGTGKKGRLRWTPDLHTVFVAAVEQLGEDFVVGGKKGKGRGLEVLTDDHPTMFLSHCLL